MTEAVDAIAGIGENLQILGLQEHQVGCEAP